jgi:hypothetical protein
MGVVVVLVTSSLTAALHSAGATVATGKTQEHAISTWVQPGTGPLDGLGTFVYLDAPAPGPTQASLLGYEYQVIFRFEAAGSGGVLAMGYKNGHKVAGFGLVPSHLVDTVPFDWNFGHIYYLLTYRMGTDLWAAWAYDWTAATWTFITQQAAPAGTGRILPTTTTSVDYDASLSPSPAADPSTCAFYPRVDAYLYPPTGWRGEVMTQATLSANSVAAGDCPAVTTTSDGWQHYALGAPASG